jgi:hypothetical protein
MIKKSTKKVRKEKLAIDNTRNIIELHNIKTKVKKSTKEKL